MTPDNITAGQPRGSGPPVPEPPPWNFGRRPDLPSDRCNMVMLLRNREDPNKCMLKMVYCDTWGCYICGPRKKKEYLHHLSNVIKEVDKIYFSTRRRGNWAAFHRRIRRLKGQYCRVEIEDGRLVIFTNVAVGELVPLALRKDFLQAVIAAATFRGWAITTSRGWKPQRKAKKPEWSRVNWLPISLKDACEVVRELGLTPREGSTYVVTELPDAWFDDDERGFRNFRRHLERGPSRPTASESEPGEGDEDVPGGQKA